LQNVPPDARNSRSAAAVVEKCVSWNADKSALEESTKLVSECKTEMDVRCDEILNTFLSKIINPNIHALASFWANDASIEMLETELMKTSV
jgi:hypothetical protein